MPISAGARLGCYEISALLGVGGMGEVYRARDTRLRRDVALKIVLEEFARDPDRRARFQREAEALAALNHPNIAAIYGVEDRALVLELVEGPTLAERLAQRPIPCDEALPIARQIAEALEYAHEKGIVHRDLKPANVKITPDGRVKVLDFGLAKALAPEPAGGDPASSPTLTMRDTLAGAIIGTAAYMSPEQARGKPVDRRSDIWAFGALLAEMLTGRMVYASGTVTETLAAVIRDQPDLDGLPPETPAPLRRLLDRCLTKDPQRRLQAIGEARIALDDAMSPDAMRQSTPPSPRARTSRLSWIIAAAFAALAAVMTLAWRARGPEEPHTIRFLFAPPDKAAIPENAGIALSPDGRHLAFIATIDGRANLWIRDFDTLTSRMLPGTEGARIPFWSPDSRYVGFNAAGKLKKIAIDGGPAITLCEASNLRGASWSPAGVILFTPSSAAPLYRVAAAGGNPVQATALSPSGGENSHRWPWFLPDGRHFLYSARNDNPEKSAIYIGDLESKGRVLAVTAPSNAVYAPPGFLLFTRERSLLAQPFDAGTGKTGGEPVPVAQQVDYIGSNQQGVFTASSNGVLAYISGGTAGNSQLTWFDRSGKQTGAVGSAAVIFHVAISPDGKTIADARRDLQAGDVEIWLHDLAHGTSSRFTFGPSYYVDPRWSWDSACIAYAVGGGPGYERGSSLAVKQAGGGAEQIVLNSQRSKSVEDWSPDGRYLLYRENDPDHGRGDLWLLPMGPSHPGSCPAPNGNPTPFLQTPFNEADPRISPDGRWVVYASDESRRSEVYVQSFPTPGSKYQVSAAGGNRPSWSRDGKEIYYANLDRELMAVPVESRSAGRFVAGAARPLFSISGGGAVAYEAAPDGKKFLVTALRSDAPNAPISLVLNWQAAVKK